MLGRWAIALHMKFYNFVRVHSILRMSSAKAAAIADRLWDMTEILAITEMRKEPPKPQAGNLSKARRDGGNFKLRRYPSTCPSATEIPTETPILAFSHRVAQDPTAYLQLSAGLAVNRDRKSPSRQSIQGIRGWRCAQPKARRRAPALR